MYFSSVQNVDCLMFNQVVLSIGQDNANSRSIAAIQEQFRQLLYETQPCVLLRCRPLQASEVSGDTFPLAFQLAPCFCLVFTLYCGFQLSN